MNDNYLCQYVGLYGGTSFGFLWTAIYFFLRTKKIWLIGMCYGIYRKPLIVTKRAYVSNKDSDDTILYKKIQA